MTALATAPPLADVFPRLAGDYTELACAITLAGWTSTVDLAPTVELDRLSEQRLTVTAFGGARFVRVQLESIGVLGGESAAFVAAFTWWGEGSVLHRGTLGDAITWILHHPRGGQP